MWRKLLTWVAGVSVGLLVLFAVVVFFLNTLSIKKTFWHSDGSSTRYKFDGWATVILIDRGKFAPFVDSETTIELRLLPAFLVVFPIAWLVSCRNPKREWFKWVCALSPLAAAVLVLRIRERWSGVKVDFLVIAGSIGGGVIYWLLRQIPSRAQRRRARGLCPQCGYDVRATPEGGTLLARCPECGTVI